MDKLCIEYQRKFLDNLIYDHSVFANIDPCVKLHREVNNHPLSSAASCLNVIGSLASNPSQLRDFLNMFGLNVDEIYEFPYGANVGGRTYKDKGYAIFEWIGPQDSPINEKGGGRGYNRTSIDAFIIAKIDGRITQVLIEWKYTEGKSSPLALGKFSGYRGLERLRRYSSVLHQWRNTDLFPFNFKDEGGIGLYDFSVDHLYQLLRITLLAKTTIDINIGHLKIEDYRIVHLSHSLNNETKALRKEHLKFSPGLQQYLDEKLYDVWKNVLSTREKNKFIGGYWDSNLHEIKDDMLRDYLTKRY
ncbi:MAG: hypothetical protein GF315_06200 [candidate division Zixibacteria bacterium]|nr:hypothetical protein [candidate division Zixibacteria bacterium]